MLLSPHLSLSSVLTSVKVCFDLAYTGLMLLLRVWRLGPGLAIVVGLLIGHQALDNTQPGGAGGGRVNFDSVQCHLRQWAQNTNTEIITHCTVHSQAWPDLTKYLYQAPDQGSFAGYRGSW